MLKKCIIGICYLSVLVHSKYHYERSYNQKRSFANEEVAPTWEHHHEEEEHHAEWDGDNNNQDQQDVIGWEGDSINDWDNESDVEESWSGPLAEPWEGDDYNGELGWNENQEENYDYDYDDEEVDCNDADKHFGETHEEHTQEGHIHNVHDVTEDASSQVQLPADAYSLEYIEALRKIGVQNVAAGAKGITYSFYTSAGACKAPQDIQNDISKIQNFEVIRIYDTDCDGISNILKTIGPNQKIFAGIHYPEVVDQSVAILGDAIQSNGGDWSKIHTVSIGNEMVNFGKATPEGLKASIAHAKTLLSARGYNGPVVTTDTLVAVLNNKELCNIGDYIAVNSHPYWDGGVPAQQAGPWLQSQLSMLNDVCERNGKQIFLAETGWPHKGKKFGQHGDPSKDNQLIAIKSIVDTLGQDTILFTTFNDYWKDGGSHDVEKYWGIYED
ncbi:putative secreted protein [Wickerhamomyces ciferrii]|uniref:Secreted protein n=1 Tax=Wickerhamomyces ciferrii (strain ATCC 14091 / BCRC 22168 / CBS 111 / JCM 3599 / NBRC 0793 / NRRL Y-1031 F-60-10) TaxID=1206466 RepID=K0KLL4_WICCF|nr:uncharacterized protein BN7_3420 [Wickerhamomyces ciferrii]CCH43866.1 putative secreted protein [Wickerhamomyces ciferrii]